MLDGPRLFRAMKFHGPITEHRVYAEWLRSELYRSRQLLTPEQVSMIEDPNLESVEQNSERKEILLRQYNRNVILDELPEELSWREAQIEERDIANLFVLPVFDWFLDSGRTFQLLNVLSHLSAGRGHRKRTTPEKILHHSKVERMVLRDEERGKPLIMISTGINGPYTIIDGTHRAVKLLQMNRLEGALCFVGLAEDLSRCYWSIQRADLAQYLARLQRLADSGLVW